MKKVWIASSKTCGPCSMLKNRVEKEEIEVEIKYFEDNFELFKKLEIKAVPRLIIENDDGEDTEKIQGMDDIVEHLKNNA